MIFHFFADFGGVISLPLKRFRGVCGLYFFDLIAGKLPEPFITGQPVFMMPVRGLRNAFTGRKKIKFGVIF